MGTIKSTVIKKSILKQLFEPSADSHKGDNGKVLIVGGSDRYHGAPLLAAEIASLLVDLVYFSSIPENVKLLEEMKMAMEEFITIYPKEIDTTLSKVDAILFGPGMAELKENKQFIEHVLKHYPQTKTILDAGALGLIDKYTLHPNCLVTPHSAEFEKLFGCKATVENVASMAKAFGGVVVLKGQTDYVSDGKTVKENHTGNPGMTKGGTGDVLAGLITGLAAMNDLYTAACVGVFVNGTAGDHLKERVGYYYNASNLIDEIPQVLLWGKKSNS